MGTAYTFFRPLPVFGRPKLAFQSKQICGLRLVTTVQYCCSPTSLSCTSHLLPVQYLPLSRSSADSGLDERQGLHKQALSISSALQVVDAEAAQLSCNHSLQEDICIK